MVPRASDGLRARRERPSTERVQGARHCCGVPWLQLPRDISFLRSTGNSSALKVRGTLTLASINISPSPAPLLISSTHTMLRIASILENLICLILPDTFLCQIRYYLLQDSDLNSFSCRRNPTTKMINAQVFTDSIRIF